MSVIEIIKAIWSRTISLKAAFQINRNLAATELSGKIKVLEEQIRQELG